jgi:hypothetical protein
MSGPIPRPLKCMIKNLDAGTSVEAFLNPKEVSINKKVPWNKHKSSKADNPVLEFTDAEPKDLSVELLFDTYEARYNVHDEYVAKLESYMQIVKDLKRPPMCLFIWGKNFPPFMGVIDSLATKYTMFLQDGTPVRATVTLTMKQADKLAAKGSGKKAATGPDYSKEGKPATQEDRKRPDKFGDNHREVLDSSGSENGELKEGEMVFGKK